MTSVTLFHTRIDAKRRSKMRLPTQVVGEVAYADALERLAKALARHPVPLMLLARLAVSVAWQGRGVGAGLPKDAMRRTLQVAEIVGIRVMAVHAKDAAARTFYEHFSFTASPTDPLHLFSDD